MSDYACRKHSSELSAAFHQNNEYEMYKKFEVEQIKAMEEQIAMLAVLKKDISPLLPAYLIWVKRVTRHALQFGDYENYENFKFRQALFQNIDNKHQED